MKGDELAECPECGEEAVHRPAIDLVPWEAHGMARPEWSHRDRSSLCPVAGPSGGFQPAQPRRRIADRGAAQSGQPAPAAGHRAARPGHAAPGADAWDPGDRFGPLHDSEGQLIEGPIKPPRPAQTDRQEEPAKGLTGGEHLRAAIARLRMTRPHAAPERDREAGA